MRHLIPLAILCELFLVMPSEAAGRSVGLSAFQLRPDRVVIAAGGAVTWRWNGPDTDHSVTARPNQAQAFDSDPGLFPGSIDHPVGFTFVQRFLRPGTYRYYCKVHPSMAGVVIVVPGDRRAPRLAGLRVTASECARGGCGRGVVQIRFVLSERARVVIRIAEAQRSFGPGGLQRSVEVRGRRGANDVRVSERGLAPGRYRARLTATDEAGNTSRPAEARFRVAARPARIASTL